MFKASFVIAISIRINCVVLTIDIFFNKLSQIDFTHMKKTKMSQITVHNSEVNFEDRIW
jgi:hypothetical protein